MKKTIKMITGMTLAGAILFSSVTTASAAVTGSMDVAEEDYSSLVSTVDTAKEQYPAENPKKDDTAKPATPAAPAAPAAPPTNADPTVAARLPNSFLGLIFTSSSLTRLSVVGLFST